MKKGVAVIVGNWKMNPPTLAEARILFAKIKRNSKNFEKIKVILCIPSLYLGAVANSGTESVYLGAQDSFWANAKRATGEISPEMLRDAGVSYVILGHSERRAFGESDEIISKKARAVIDEGLVPILCVGEKERDEEARYFNILKEQIKDSLAGIKKPDLREFFIAYEPVWAIGKSARDAMKPRDICETAIFIRKVIADLFDSDSAKAIGILYGGSVEKENASEILSEGGVDGLLIGHASLDYCGFSEILKRADKRI